MSAETVQIIIGRAVTDVEFRELLFNDPDEATSGYELTEEEQKSLKNITRDSFEKVQSELEERLSKAGFNPGSFAHYVKKWTGPDLNLSGITKTLFTPTDGL